MRTIWIIPFVAFILSASAACTHMHPSDHDAPKPADQGSQQPDKSQDMSDD